MSIKSDRWIRRQAEAGMIEPFEAGQVRTANGGRIVSYGTSSYGYDVRCADNSRSSRTSIPPSSIPRISTKARSWTSRAMSASFRPIPSLARTVEYFRIPRSVLTICLGKSTYARCGIIVNVTPLEPEWEGHVTLEFSNTTPLPAKIYAGEGCAQMLFLESDEVCEVLPIAAASIRASAALRCLNVESPKRCALPQGRAEGGLQPAARALGVETAQPLQAFAHGGDAQRQQVLEIGFGHGRSAAPVRPVRRSPGPGTAAGRCRGRTGRSGGRCGPRHAWRPGLRAGRRPTARATAASTSSTTRCTGVQCRA